MCGEKKSFEKFGTCGKEGIYRRNTCYACDSKRKRNNEGNKRYEDRRKKQRANDEKYKETMRVYSANWKQKNPEYHKNYYRNHKDYFRLHGRKFRENNPGYCKLRYEKERAHRKYLYVLNREKAQASRAANIYLNKNNIKKLLCSSCSASKNMEMHHQDYSKPLEVAFLCKSCHRMLHYGHDINYTIVNLKNM